MKIRYILVDDHQHTLDSVKRKIDTIADVYDLEHVASYNSSVKASKEIDNQSYDVLIVDYDMPGFNGVQLAERIAVSKKIIFLTSTTGKQTQIINSLDVSGYLSKPFELEEFENILKKKIIGKIQLSKSYTKGKITLTTGDSNYIFDIKDAYYITTAKNIRGYKSKKNYVSIYGKNDEILIENIRMTISYLSKVLEPYKFEKITQRTMINLSHVKSRISNEVSLYHCKQEFEITSKGKSSFISKIASFFNPKK